MLYVQSIVTPQNIIYNYRVMDDSTPTQKKESLTFLKHVMRGVDPRERDPLYEFIKDLDGAPPTDEEWDEILLHIKTEPVGRPVKMSDSLSAGKALAEYEHAKLKSIEVKGDIKSELMVKNSPLTDDEIARFRDVFNDEF